MKAKTPMALLSRGGIQLARTVTHRLLLWRHSFARFRVRAVKAFRLLLGDEREAIALSNQCYEYRYALYLITRCNSKGLMTEIANQALDCEDLPDPVYVERIEASWVR